MIRSVHVGGSAVGRTHAINVMPVLRSSAGESAMVIGGPAPANCTAPPIRPPQSHVAPPRLAVFPLPESSTTVVPAPSSNEYAATRPGLDAVAWKLAV